MKSWMEPYATCKECKYEVVVTQGKEADYRYYCSNPDCKYHEKVEVYDSDDLPVFVRQDDV